MIAFQFESLKNVTFNVVSFSVVDRSVGELGETPCYVHLHSHHKSNVAVVWEHAPSHVWAGLRYFFYFLNAACSSTRLPPHKKLLCKSHSSLNSEWWAVLTLKPGSEQSLAYISKKSVIHAVVNVFCFFLLLCCRLNYNPCLLCSPVFLLTGACCSLHTTRFFKCYNTVIDKGKPLFCSACSAGVLPSLLTFCLFYNTSVQLKHRTPARSVCIT